MHSVLLSSYVFVVLLNLSCPFILILVILPLGGTFFVAVFVNLEFALRNLIRKNSLLLSLLVWNSHKGISIEKKVIEVFFL